MSEQFFWPWIKVSKWKMSRWLESLWSHVFVNTLRVSILCFVWVPLHGAFSFTSVFFYPLPVVALSPLSLALSLTVCHFVMPLSLSAAGGSACRAQSLQHWAATTTTTVVRLPCPPSEALLTMASIDSRDTGALVALCQGGSHTA